MGKMDGELLGFSRPPILPIVSPKWRRTDFWEMATSLGYSSPALLHPSPSHPLRITLESRPTQCSFSTLKSEKIYPACQYIQSFTPLWIFVFQNLRGQLLISLLAALIKPSIVLLMIHQNRGDPSPRKRLKFIVINHGDSAPGFRL